MITNDPIPADAKRESDGARLARMGTDATEWAREFWKMFGDQRERGISEEIMIAWFANAIEAGRSAGWRAGLASERDGGLP